MACNDKQQKTNCDFSLCSFFCQIALKKDKLKPIDILFKILLIMIRMKSERILTNQCPVTDEHSDKKLHV